MNIEIKWLEGVRKRPVPAKYLCNLALDNPPTEVWSCIIYFQHNVRTLGDLHLYKCEYLDVPDHFFLTEGGRVVAEASILQEPIPTLMRSVKTNGVLSFQIEKDGKWVDVPTCPSNAILFHKTKIIVEYDTKFHGI